MGLVGILGLLGGLIPILWLFRRPTRTQVATLVAAYVLHVGSAYFYFYLTSTGAADSAFYYYDPGGVYGQGFGANTTFIIYIVQAIKEYLGGSYLDHFFFFQAFGFAGVVILLRTFEEIFAEVQVVPPIYVYLLLLQPSLHYWTASIGKDSLFFVAATAFIWGSLKIQSRWLIILASVVLVVLVRAQIALLFTACFIGAILIDSKMRLWLRISLAAVGAVGAAWAVWTVWSTWQIDLTNLDTFSDALAGREALVQTEDAGNTAVDAIYPIRVLSLLFRPFFYDAPGALGYVASLENLILLLVMASFTLKMKTSLLLLRNVPFARFALGASLVVLFSLAIGYYNVGLGIRQKVTMILPGLLVFFAASRAISAATRAPDGFVDTGFAPLPGNRPAWAAGRAVPQP